MSFIHAVTNSMFGCDAEHDGYRRSHASFAVSVHRREACKEEMTEPQEERGRAKTRSGVSSYSASTCSLFQLVSLCSTKETDTHGHRCHSLSYPPG